MQQPSLHPWDAKKIRYIKLGLSGSWAQDCFKDGLIRLGFASGSQELNLLASKGNWAEVRSYWLQYTRTPSVATAYTNQMREFFEDDGTTLWITIEDGFLYYGFSGGGPVIPFGVEGDDSGYRKMSSAGWSNADLNNDPLRVDQLNGALTAVAGYRGTICSFKEPVEKYLRLKLEAKVGAEVKEAQLAKSQLLEKIKPLIQSLTWRDFEILIELIFGNSGWRRLSSTGGVQKTIDIELENPVTGDLAFVQIKSRSSQAELDSYIELHERSAHKRMFFVYHTSSSDLKVSDSEIYDSEEKILSLWDVDRIAEQVFQNGLVDWVINRAK